MVIDKRDIDKINVYTVDNFAEWFSVGFDALYGEEDDFYAFKPLHGYVGKGNDIIRELGDIYNFLSPLSKLMFRKGLAKAFSVLSENYISPKIARRMLNLTRLINAQEMLEPIVQKVGNGFLGFEGSEEKKRLFVLSLDVVKKISNCTVGSSYLERMIGSRFFSYEYAPMAFIALCQANPNDFPEHLSLLRGSFYRLHMDADRKKKSFFTANRFVNIIDIKLLSISFKDLLLSDNPNKSKLSDNWFAEALFVGEESPLAIDRCGDVFKIRRKDGYVFVPLDVGAYEEDYEINSYLDKLVLESFCYEKVLESDCIEGIY